MLGRWSRQQNDSFAPSLTVQNDDNIWLYVICSAWRTGRCTTATGTCWWCLNRANSTSQPSSAGWRWASKLEIEKNGSREQLESINETIFKGLKPSCDFHLLSTFYILGWTQRDLRDPTRHQVQRGCGRTNKRVHSRGGISECVDSKTFHPYWQKNIKPKGVRRPFCPSQLGTNWSKRTCQSKVFIQTLDKNSTNIK